MADTIPLIKIGSAWTDMYAASGISVGTAVAVNLYNPSDKADGAIIATSPVDDTAVVPIVGTRQFFITSGESGFWMRAAKPGGVRVSIQDNT